MLLSTEDTHEILSVVINKAKKGYGKNPVWCLLIWNVLFFFNELISVTEVFTSVLVQRADMDD